MSAGRGWLIVLVVVVAMGAPPGIASAADGATPGGEPSGALPPTAAPLPGFPDPSNTGVPAGTRLRPSGGLLLSTPGEVVDGLDIEGPVRVTADHVTIRRSRIRNRAYSVVEVAEDVTGTVLEDVELDGTGQALDNNGVYGDATIRRADIHGVAYGAALESGSVLVDSFIHDLAGPGSTAYVGVLIDGDRTDVTIRHNTIIVTAQQTAAVLLSNYFGPLASIRIEGNHLSGGAYTVDVDGGFTSGPVDDVRITANRFGTHRLGYGTIRHTTLADEAGNVDAVTGQAVGLDAG